MDLKFMFRIWKDIFGKLKYSLLALFIAALFYSLNIIINNWGILRERVGFSETLELFFVLFVNLRSIIPGSSVFLIIISLLFGILFSMLAYKAHFSLSVKDEEIGIIGEIGAFLAVFVSGCAACGAGVATVFGIGAGILAFLPYHGIELSILSVIILTATIYKTTKNMYVCEVPLSNLKPIKPAKPVKSKGLNKKNRID